MTTRQALILVLRVLLGGIASLMLTMLLMNWPHQIIFFAGFLIGAFTEWMMLTLAEARAKPNKEEK